MAHVKKCDTCGTMDETVKTYGRRLGLFAGDKKLDAVLELEIRLPGFSEYERKELCSSCLSDLVRLCMPMLFELLKPHQPQRVPGFVQGEIVQEDSPRLSKAERAALKALGQRLLKA